MGVKQFFNLLILLHFIAAGDSQETRDDRDYLNSRRDNGNIKKFLPVALQPKSTEKRVQVGFINDFEGKELKTVLPEAVVSCGQTGDLTCAKQHVIHSTDFPTAASKSSSCDFRFDIQPDLQVSLYFYDFNVQCRFGSYLNVYYDEEFFGSICENGIYTNVYVPLPPAPLNQTQIRLEHVVSRSKRPFRRGLFQGVVIGFGSVCPNPPAPPTTTPTPWLSQNCGISNFQSRIIDGRPASVGEYRWLVYLTLGGVACDGTIINNEWIMTAAHCVESVINNPQDINIQLGCHDLSSSTQPEACQASSLASEVILHSGYPGTFADNDIALLRTTAPLAFTERIGPVCIPVNPVSIGRILAIAGWGESGPNNNPSELREASSTTISDEECEADLPSVLCTKSEDQLRNGNICFGDSGGFLGDMSAPEGHWSQHGISSYVYGLCEADRPQGFTEVSHYTSWIESYTGIISVQNL